MNKNVFLITGASRGIGKAIAIKAASVGAEVVVTCKSKRKELSIVLKELNKYNINTYGWVGDLSCSSSVQKMKQQLELAVKRKKISSMPNIIINNAGISYIGLVQNTCDKIWEDIIGVNLSAPFYISREFIPYMIKNQLGIIVNISSMWGKCGASCEVAYSASKAGLEGLTKALALELEPSNVHVIAYRIGLVDTDMNCNIDKKSLYNIVKETISGKIGMPYEIADYIVDDIIRKNYKTGDIKDVPYGWLKNV